MDSDKVNAYRQFLILSSKFARSYSVSAWLGPSDSPQSLVVMPGSSRLSAPRRFRETSPGSAAVGRKGFLRKTFLTRKLFAVVPCAETRGWPGQALITVRGQDASGASRAAYIRNSVVANS